MRLGIDDDVPTRDQTLALLEVRQHVGVAPTRGATRSPGIEVPGMAAHIGHVVDPGRAPEHLPARHHHPTVGEAEPGVAGIGGIHPVRLRVQLQRRTSRRHQLRRGRRTPRFHQSHPASGILGEPGRYDRTGRPTTHDDKIKLFCHDSDPPSALPPIVQQHRTQVPGVYTVRHESPQTRRRSACGNLPAAEAAAAARNDGSRASSGTGAIHRTRPPRPYRLRGHQEHRPPVPSRQTMVETASDAVVLRCDQQRAASSRPRRSIWFLSERGTAPRHSSPKHIPLAKPQVDMLSSA